MNSRSPRRTSRTVAWAALVVGALAAALAVFLMLAQVPADDANVRLLPAVVSAVSLVLSAVVFLSNRNSGSAPDEDTGSVTASGPGSVAAGRDTVGNAVGPKSSAGPSRPPTSGSSDTARGASKVTASGSGAVAAGRDAIGNATGDSSAAS